MALSEADNGLETEALVFKVSGITVYWIHPIAHFIQNKIYGSVKTQLIKDYPRLL